MAKAHALQNVCPGERYWELARRFPLRPIRSDAELGRAIEVIDALIDQGERDQDEEDYLEVLGNQVQIYESEHHPMPPVSDADMLRHLIEARETTQARVAADTGISESTVSEVLAGKRKLNRRHIEALSRHFKVNPGVFISEPGR
jgi:HTH-type transcriptional regulator/antitoxin HigA